LGGLKPAAGSLQKPIRQPMQNEQLAKTRSASQNAQSPHQSF